MNRIKFTAALTITTVLGLLGLMHQWLNAPVPQPRVASIPATAETLNAGRLAERKHQEFIRASVIAAELYEANGCTTAHAERTARFAISTGLPVRIVAADVIVESSCRPNIISAKGAVGLTQVMPSVWHVTREELLDPDRNLEVGTQVLASYVHRYGMHEGLRHYLGTGTSDGAIDGYSYADHVLAVANGQR